MYDALGDAQRVAAEMRTSLQRRAAVQAAWVGCGAVERSGLLPVVAVSGRRSALGASSVKCVRKGRRADLGIRCGAGTLRSARGVLKASSSTQVEPEVFITPETDASSSTSKEHASKVQAGPAVPSLKTAVVYALTLCAASLVLLVVALRVGFRLCRRAVRSVPQVLRWTLRLVYRLMRLAYVLAHDTQQAVLQKSAPNLVDVKSIADSSTDVRSSSDSHPVASSSLHNFESTSSISGAGGVGSASAVIARKDEVISTETVKEPVPVVEKPSTSNSRRSFQVALIVMRHAESERNLGSGGGSTNASEVGRDFDRKLTGRGIREAESIASKLHSIGVVPDRVLASSSVRTKMTAEKILEGLRKQDCDSEEIPLDAVLCEDMYYAMDAHEMGIVLEKHAISSFTSSHNSSALPTCKRLLVVGHNPGIEALITKLTGRALSMHAGSAVVLEPARISSSRRWTRAYLNQTWRVSHVLTP